MSAIPKNNPEHISELFNLEIRAINGQKPTSEDLLSAIKLDVQNHIPISKTAIFKHFTCNHLLSKNDLMRVLSLLQDGISTSIAFSYDAVLSYTHAAIIISSEISKVSTSD